MKQISLSLLVLCLFSSCSHKVYDSLDWQSNKVTVDGKIPEWPNPLRFYNDKSKLNYTITNDRWNLYLCMKISDVTAQIKMLRGGMEFRIDTLGKKSFPIALIYPIANHQMTMRNRGESQTGRNPRDKPEHSSMAQNLLIQAKELELVGFKTPLGGILSLFNTSYGILAAMDIDSLGIMYYEAVIPFRTFIKNELTAADTNKAFSYEIKINAVPAPQSHEGGGGNRSMGGGSHGGIGMSGGGYGGGGMGGGHHGGGMGGSGMHGGGQRSSNGNTSENNELYSTNKVTKQLRFSFK
jgi:hypothetical protein